MTASNRSLQLLLSKQGRGQAASKIELHLHPSLAADVEAYRCQEEGERQRDPRFLDDAKRFSAEAAAVALISFGIIAVRKYMTREEQLQVGLPEGCDPTAFR